MHVSVEKILAWDDLEQRLREIPLLEMRDGQAVYPYEDADISLEQVAYTDVSPTTLYVVRKNLAIQAALADELAAEGYDPLELTCGLILRNQAGEDAGLIPPIVEETEAEGKYLLDGAHRTSIGRWIGRTHFLAVHITGIRPDCPAYAYPNSWDDIRIMEEVPNDPAKKKQYRDENYRSLYRDMSLLNGGRLREV